MVSQKKPGRGGRPREFEESEALAKMQRELWTTGLSGATLDGIARSAGLNRPSLAAAFGDKDAIYAQAAARYAGMMDERLSRALDDHDLEVALRRAFDAAIESNPESGEAWRGKGLLHVKVEEFPAAADALAHATVARPADKALWYMRGFAEERAGESLDQLLAEEEPEPDPYAEADLPREGPFPDDDPEPRAGRLVAEDEGAHAVQEADLVARDVGIDGGAAGAEEAAVHVEDEHGS